MRATYHAYLHTYPYLTHSHTTCHTGAAVNFKLPLILGIGLVVVGVRFVVGGVFGGGGGVVGCSVVGVVGVVLAVGVVWWW